MTSYITITDAETDPSAPLTSELAKKWRDNPIAIAEGEDLAPRVLGEAAGRDSSVVARRLPVATVAAGSVASAQGQGAVTGTTSTTSLTNVVGQTYTIRSYSGTLRFSITSTNSGGGGTTIVEIYKNNVLVQAYAGLASGASATRTNDIAIAVGDVIEWRHRTTGAGVSVLTSAVVSADNPYVLQDFYRLNSNA